ncbi:MAG: ROK family protein [Planctomycetaceae bacterium]|nr:ROK family protein [Planctomycetaceae bacterium]
MPWYFGIESGGTKLQIAVGRGEGEPFRGVWRGVIDAALGASRIQQQIVTAVDELLVQSELPREKIAGVGIGFGGPVDSNAGRIVVSHQVPGWQNFPIVDWVRENLGWPAVLHNDADTAAFAEAKFGAGRGFDPVLYVTVGSGIGGGLVCGGTIFRGGGAGAMEIGHLRPLHPALRVLPAGETVESIASGFGIENRARTEIAARLEAARAKPTLDTAGKAGEIDQLIQQAGGDLSGITTRLIAAAAAAGDALCLDLLADSTKTLGWALGQAITLINPARIVIGGGVSLVGEALFFEPLRRACRAATFGPFVGLAEILPAALGEDVVIHGALALAKVAFAT